MKRSRVHSVGWLLLILALVSCMGPRKAGASCQLIHGIEFCTIEDTELSSPDIPDSFRVSSVHPDGVFGVRTDASQAQSLAVSFGVTGGGAATAGAYLEAGFIAGPGKPVAAPLVRTRVTRVRPAAGRATYVVSSDFGGTGTCMVEIYRGGSRVLRVPGRAGAAVARLGAWPARVKASTGTSHAVVWGWELASPGGIRVVRGRPARPDTTVMGDEVRMVSGPALHAAPGLGTCFLRARHVPSLSIYGAELRPASPSPRPTPVTPVH
ncbi:MAG: hypothetical protein HZC42_06805 [Candidatus Eisenbacteria bacterium]|nr:hypothetical protein [Candidatus Eisenbacteria bacterium]